MTGMSAALCHYRDKLQEKRFKAKNSCIFVNAANESGLIPVQHSSLDTILRLAELAPTTPALEVIYAELWG